MTYFINSASQGVRILHISSSIPQFCILLQRLNYCALQVIEQKGLDIVRRDWCPLSKDAGNYALDQILSGQAKEDVVNAVHAKLGEANIISS